MLKTEKGFDAYIPYIIASKSQKNNCFNPYFNRTHHYKMQIFDRWGEMVCWDGHFNGRLVEDGVYMYRILVDEFNCQEAKEFVGSVTVVY